MLYQEQFQTNSLEKKNKKMEGKDYQNLCSDDRVLTEEEKSKLQADMTLVSEFKQMKLEKEAKKNWDLFYKRNTTKFFKDRHWTKREFEELTNLSMDDGEKRCCFEVGCGVGNFLFPLLEEDRSLFFYACDFSPRAVEFVKSNTAYDPKRCHAFQCDITSDDVIQNVPEGSVDIATLIFVLSAIHPDKMVQAVRNITRTLKADGVLLIRDYGLYDHAMLRFSKGHKLSECFYVRQDGTRAFYFSLDKMEEIMMEAGLEKLECCYIQRSTVNKKEGIDVARIFIQGKFTRSRNEQLCQDFSGGDSALEKATNLKESASDVCDKFTPGKGNCDDKASENLNSGGQS